MKINPTTKFTAIVLFALMQSCTVPNPYQPLNNTTASTESGSNNNNNSENEGSSSNSGTSTGSTTTGTGTTIGGTTNGNTGGISSKNGSSKSHNMGQNCMNCHNPGGGEAPVWQIAGTVYNQAMTATYPNATVNLYTGPNGTGTLKYTIKVDARGNFYTSGTIDFTGGLYPSVTGTSTNFMSSSITTGACNSCHNTDTMDRIWIN